MRLDPDTSRGPRGDGGRIGDPGLVELDHASSGNAQDRGLRQGCGGARRGWLPLAAHAQGPENDRHTRAESAEGGVASRINRASKGLMRYRGSYAPGSPCQSGHEAIARWSSF
jgi:hypothetical protein